ncbi:MAG: HAMP domain-containing sensor histidine kinase [Nitriliruptorales bacterium]|nr:HAMP domain-containing sensor histidine kinase [Nitriliruptorales bacterium]
MSQAVELARWVSTGLFVALAIGTGYRAWRRRRPSAVWAFVTFGALALVSVLGRVLPADAPLLVEKANIVLLLAFAWALFRFAASFGRIAPRWVRIGDLVTFGLAVWTLLLPELPTDSRPAWFETWLTAFVVTWVGLVTAVGVSLWRAGRTEPTVARRRMRLLGSGAFAMGIALIGAAYAPDGSAEPWSLAVQLLAVASAVAFVLGLAPPPTLRIAWRQPEERKLYTSAIKLLSATHRDEVAPLVLPDVAAVVGAEAAWVLDADGELLATHGDRPGSVDQAMSVPAGPHTIHVRPSRYAPFFGDEEQRLLRRLTLLAGLAFERIEAVEREREARAEAEAANEELEAFVYSASHDLKSPLIAMLGYLGVVDQEYGETIDERLAWYLERMRVNGAYMRALIDDLLELSRVGRVDTDVTAVPLGEVATEVADEIGARYPEATIKVGELPVIWLNDVRARQLFTNLLENACRYGGRPDVRVAVRADRGPHGAVVIAVEDDGQGIPAEYRDRVFGVFERLAPEDSPGTGIGLAICAKIVEAADGDIHVEEGAAGGARVVVTLPPSAHVDAPAQEMEVRS